MTKLESLKKYLEVTQQKLDGTPKGPLANFLKQELKRTQLRIDDLTLAGPSKK